VEVGPQAPAAPGRPAPRPGPAGLTVGAPGPRRPTPMVASKAEADGLVSGAESLAGLPKTAPGGSAAAVATNPYAGVGRNDPCPCGSGKKFKKCHGAGL